MKTRGVTSLLLLALALPAGAQQAQPDSAIHISEVVAIGTRTRDRSTRQSPVPIDVVSAAMLQSTGVVETWQMLQRLIPSLNVPHVPRGDNAMRPITLRGLAPHQVLVLVNGKRRHSAAVTLGGPVLGSSVAVDITGLPSSAIERIEILRDGAAAQYGSDAIAGVVNVVLKKGEPKEGKFSFGQVRSSEGGRTHHDGMVRNWASTYGGNITPRIQAVWSLELRDRDPTNRAYPDLRPQYFAGDPRNGNPAPLNTQDGDGEARSIATSVNGSALLVRNVEAYAFGTLSYRDAIAAEGPRRPSSDSTVRSLHPDGLVPDVARGVLDFAGFAGLRSQRGGWHFDLSSGFGANRNRYRVLNTNNASLGNDSPTEFYTGTLKSRQWSNNLDVSRRVDVGRSAPLNMAFGAEVRLDNYVIEAGEPDSYGDGGVPILDGPNAGKRAPPGAQGMVGFRSIDATAALRTEVAAYADVESPISTHWLVDAAARAEHFSDYGGSTVARLATRFQLVRWLALRGALGQGFRAPSLIEEHYATTRTVLRNVNGVTRSFIVRTMPVGSPEAIVLGARPLKPETSFNRSAGIIFDIPGGPVITTDYYWINIHDRIVQSGEFTDTSVTRILEQHGFQNVQGGSYFANAIDTRTHGLDVIALYQIPLRQVGLLRLTAGYNATRTRVTRIAEAPPELRAFQSVLFNRPQQGAIEQGQPRDMIIATIGLTSGKMQLELHNQRFGQTALLDRVNPARDQIAHAKWLTDASVAYQINGHLRAMLAGSNLFDVYPDEWNDFKDGVNAQGMSLNGRYRYPGGISPFGANGRTLYAHISYR